MVAVATTDAILLTKHAKEIGVAPRAFVGFGGGFGVEDFAKELGPQSQNVFLVGGVVGQSQRPRGEGVLQEVPRQVRHLAQGARGRGLSIVYVIADAMRRAPLTGNVDADREAIRQALLKTDMTTVFGKLKFGNWPGHSETRTPTRTSTRRTTRCWRSGSTASCRTSGPSPNAEASYVFPDNTVKR